MLLKLTNLFLVENRQGLAVLPEGKLLINTINAHSYNTAQKDRFFAEALQRGDVLIPDGASIVKACRWPVSYTHLDVYKRQLLNVLEK